MKLTETLGNKKTKTCNVAPIKVEILLLFAAKKQKIATDSGTNVNYETNYFCS